MIKTLSPLLLICCFTFCEGRSALDAFRTMRASVKGQLEESSPWATHDFVKPIGSIAGEPIFPRRFESNIGVESYTFDENGIAYARRRRPTIEQILGNGIRVNSHALH